MANKANVLHHKNVVSAREQTWHRRVAFHEAGHAVVALLQGRRITRIIIEPSAARVNGATAAGQTLLAPMSSAHPADFLGELMTLLAGRAAEDIAAGRPATPKTASAAFSLSSILSSFAGDLKAAYEVAAVLGYGNEQEDRRWWKELFLATRALLDENRASLEALANVLISEGTISGRRAHQIINGALSRPSEAHSKRQRPQPELRQVAIEGGQRGKRAAR